MFGSKCADHQTAGKQADMLVKQATLLKLLAALQVTVFKYST